MRDPAIQAELADKLNKMHKTEGGNVKPSTVKEPAPAPAPLGAATPAVQGGTKPQLVLESSNDSGQLTFLAQQIKTLNDSVSKLGQFLQDTVIWQPKGGAQPPVAPQNNDSNTPNQDPGYAIDTTRNESLPGQEEEHYNSPPEFVPQYYSTPRTPPVTAQPHRRGPTYNPFRDEHRQPPPVPPKPTVPQGFYTGRLSPGRARRVNIAPVQNNFPPSAPPVNQGEPPQVACVDIPQTKQGGPLVSKGPHAYPLQEGQRLQSPIVTQPADSPVYPARNPYPAPPKRVSFDNGNPFMPQYSTGYRPPQPYQAYQIPQYRQNDFLPRYQPERPPKYTGEDTNISWHDWRANFERYARAFALPPGDPRACDMLALNLDGPALQYFNLIAPEYDHHYDACLNALELKFGSRKAFNIASLAQKEGEAAPNFTHRFIAGMRAAYGPHVLTDCSNSKWIIDTYCNLIRDKQAVLHIHLQEPPSLDRASQILEQYEAHTTYTSYTLPLAAPVMNTQSTTSPQAKEKLWFGIKAPYKGKYGMCWFCGSKAHVIRGCEEALKELTRLGKPMPPPPKPKALPNPPPPEPHFQ